MSPIMDAVSNLPTTIELQSIEGHLLAAIAVKVKPMDYKPDVLCFDLMEMIGKQVDLSRYLDKIEKEQKQNHPLLMKQVEYAGTWVQVFEGGHINSMEWDIEWFEEIDFDPDVHDFMVKKWGRQALVNCVNYGGEGENGY